ncbi:MAG: anhydro-N-acetylmuramic acid kinase [Bacteroidia bacterium]
MISTSTTGSLDVIGLMSGTSLDGIDLAACRFDFNGERYRYTLLAAETIAYHPDWTQRLTSLFSAPAASVFETDAALGKLYGETINLFRKKHGLSPLLIASHGHTVFHQPSRGYTTQIGSGAHIAAITGLDTVCDFRSKDVALNGQGAPLVPVGDHFLFAEFTACLNLGGIANISLVKDGRRIAWDICPVNMALNELAQRTGRAYDEAGALARSGRIIPSLLEKMNALPFYVQSGPKSLGREWYELSFRPLLEEGSPADLSATVCEHIALRHADVFRAMPAGASVLVTGGGAYHSFLLEKMQEKGNTKLVVPDEQLINFKEAIVFAFLGALNFWGSINVFDSATGSVKDHIGGALYRGL